MLLTDPKLAREFAVQVVAQLRQHAFEAYWAGGCVRDQLLGLAAKDYDVATSAPPDDVRRVFGYRRTLPIGASFGVITVLGPRGAGQIEVATFRRDAAYSDGRHPDAVTFSTAEADAHRRDFTINGLFYDPLTETVLDFVGGQDDLRRGIIRAIGDPHSRFAEDKLRLLRAIRFAATFQFQLDAATLAAVRHEAAHISAVSAERIAAEMQRMLVHEQRASAMQLLHESRLLAYVLPEVDQLAQAAAASSSGNSSWLRTLAVLAVLREPTFPLALAALVREAGTTVTSTAALVAGLSRRWRLANDEADRTQWLLEHEPQAREAPRLPWPRLQRLLIHPGARELLALGTAVAHATGAPSEAWDLCAQKLNLPPEVLNPPPLLSGSDLIAAGLRPGPAFKEMLEAVRDAQLEHRVSNLAEALALARQWSPP